MNEQKEAKEPNKKTREQEYLEGWKRAQADLANYKKDEAKRFQEFAKLANEGLIRSLLPILDSLEMAVANGDDKGLYMIKSQMETVLKDAGLEAIKPSEGDEFNPVFHEAIAGEGGIVAEIMSVGYVLNDRVIRPAKVKTKD